LNDTIRALLAAGRQQGIFSGAAAGIATETDTLTVVEGYPRASAEDPLEAGDWFDLASLTKPLATTLAVADLASRGLLRFDDRLVDLFDEPLEPPKDEITVAMLLEHTAGFPAWRPYFEDLRELPWSERRRRFLDHLLTESLESIPGRTTRYSDLGFMLLGVIVERVGGMDLDAYVATRIYEPLGLDLFFNRTGPTKTIRPGRYVATSRCAWRQRLLIGEVHDDNAWAVGGVAGHAGLFGTIGAVTELVRHLLVAWTQGSSLAAIKAEVVAQLCNHAGPAGSNRALGFDRPDTKNSAAGSHFPRAAVGHLGFTGTSFWIDPDRRLGVVLLTNRVHMGDDPEPIRRFRPWFHDRVLEFITA